MARYELRTVGVFDKETGKHLTRGRPGWDAYQRWLAEGNVVDEPVVPPPPPPPRVTDPAFLRAGEAREARQFAKLDRDAKIDALLRKM